MPIDYAAITKAGGIGKGTPRKKLKARRDRADAKALKAFRDVCWKREEDKLFYGEPIVPDGYNIAACQHCGATVMRGPDVMLTGEVHHRKSRRHKETRYDPENGVLLCNFLVNDCHARAGRGEIHV